MEKWKSWAFGIGAGWVLLAFVSWHVDSTCGVFFSKACFSEFLEWARWIILLKWVNPYQQLLAGMAAVAGGAFVIFAGREQIQHLRETRARERIDNALDGFYTIGTMVSDYRRQITIESARTAPAPIPTPDPSLLRDLHYISPQLAQHFLRVKWHSENFSRRCATNSDYFRLNQPYQIGYATCLFHIFSQIGKEARENIDFKPRILLSSFDFDQEPVERACAKYSLQKKHLGIFFKFFPITALTIPPSP
ncbi:hypothetical protein [Brucella pseudogrignonensis]|uniref:hypothetical protein n=1 Tax=Brucella pseudogrignonensis TaxID=419475 RepID=UPI003BA15245